MSWQWMSAAFLLRVIIGCVYGYLYSHAKQDLSDTWKFFFDAEKQASIFQNNPLSFFSYDIVDHPIYSSNFGEDIFKQDQSFFNDLHDILFTRVVNFFNILSGNRYYINVIIFNIGMIWGSINMGRLLIKFLPSNKPIIIFFLFIYPSFLYWNAGVHRDGLAFWLLSTILFFSYKLSANKKSKHSFVLLFLILLELSFLFIFKIYWVLLVTPYLLLFLITYLKKAKNSHLYFIILSIIGLIFFASSSYFPTSYRLTEKLAEKQYNFLTDVHGTIRLNLPFLSSSIYSYFKVVPYALHNLFLTPAFQDWFSVVGIFALFGQCFFWGFLILFMIFPVKNWKTIMNQPFILFLLFFSISNYAIIGITIPYLSALIRYLINFQTFILIILGCIIDWNRIFALRIFKKININKFAKK
jgi:hypothetical protein